MGGKPHEHTLRATCALTFAHTPAPQLCSALLVHRLIRRAVDACRESRPRASVEMRCFLCCGQRRVHAADLVLSAEEESRRVSLVASARPPDRSTGDGALSVGSYVL